MSVIPTQQCHNRIQDDVYIGHTCTLELLEQSDKSSNNDASGPQ